MNNYHSPQPNSKMILFSNNDKLIDAIHELSIKLSKGIFNYSLISMSKYSLDRGKIKFSALKEANAIIANIRKFTNYLKTAKKLGTYQYLENIIEPRKFDLIILDNAYEIISHNTTITNLLEIWEPIECHALVICKSNDKYFKTKQELATLQTLIELEWMEHFYPDRAFIDIEHIS